MGRDTQLEQERQSCYRRSVLRVRVMTIDLSTKALEKAKELSRTHRGRGLRLYLEGKGCDGFYYGIVFDQPSPSDLHFPQGGIDLIVDPDTIEFVAGATIDWVDDDRGRGFLVHNPRHKEFRGKFYRRSGWQKRLAAKAKKT